MRDDPELNRQIRTASTVDDRDASSFDSARIDEIVSGAVATLLRFTLTASVDDDRARRAWLVLELDCVVVEAGLLIVEPDVAILVKLTRWLRRGSHTSGARCRGAGAARIRSADADGCSHALTTEVSCVNGNG